MRATGFRLTVVTLALLLAGPLAIARAGTMPAAASGAAVTVPAARADWPAGPPALLPDGRAAPPPRISAPLVSGCRAAPYGPHFYAPGSGRTVALTFDDGPGASTAKILSILRAYHVRATFFNLGQNAAARPRRVRDEARAGEAIGNHTWNHPSMTSLSASAQAAEIDRASAELRSLTGAVPCLFRPPYGTYNATTLRLAQGRKMTVWLWSVDTEDWKARGSASSYWVRRIISLAEREGLALRHPVVLMHNQPAGNPATVAALPAIIKFFRARGYAFVDLLGRR
jgi:peptidoglycan-N-acetylglucosamine deacetylase